MAIVGSREYPGLHLVAKHVAALSDVVVTGDASGVDSAAYAAAQAGGLQTQLYAVERQKYGKWAGPIHNQQIVHDADQLLTFWDRQSKGTKNSIDLARKKGIPVPIIPPHELKENAVLPLDALCPHPRNYRQHPHKQIKQIATLLT